MRSLLQVGRRGVSIFGAVAVGSIVGVGGMSLASGLPALPAGGDGHFKVNRAGMSYGTIAQAKSPAHEPDLILAQGAHGALGYVRRVDLELPAPRTPQEALAQQAATANQDGRTIPLFDADGHRVIGTFVVERGDSGPVPETNR